MLSRDGSITDPAGLGQRVRGANSPSLRATTPSQNSEDEAMRRIAISIMVATLLACGGSDTADTADADTGAAGSMAAGSEAGHDDHSGHAAAGGTVGGNAPVRQLEPPHPAAAASQPPLCLTLIARERYDIALNSCIAALEADPDNPELQAAVEKVNAAKAGVAASGAAAADSAGGMADDAAARFKATADAAAAGLE